MEYRYQNNNTKDTNETTFSYNRTCEWYPRFFSLVKRAYNETYITITWKQIWLLKKPWAINMPIKNMNYVCMSLLLLLYWIMLLQCLDYIEWIRLNLITKISRSQIVQLFPKKVYQNEIQNVSLSLYIKLVTYLNLCFVTTCLKHRNLLLSNRVKLSFFFFLFFAW